MVYRRNAEKPRCFIWPLAADLWNRGTWYLWAEAVEKTSGIAVSFLRGRCRCGRIHPRLCGDPVFWIAPVGLSGFVSEHRRDHLFSQRDQFRNHGCSVSLSSGTDGGKAVPQDPGFYDLLCLYLSCRIVSCGLHPEFFVSDANYLLILEKKIPNKRKEAKSVFAKIIMAFS